MLRILLMVVATLSGSAFAMPDFTPLGTQPGLEFPLRSADNCVNCHRVFGSEDEAEFFPHNSWAGSMLANATRDPLFWAALDVANHDKPGVGDFCLRCHTPKAWLEGRVAKTTDGGVIDGANGCYLEGGPDQSDSDSNDYQGVTCHYCHRVDPQLDATVALDNANVNVDDAACDGGSEPCRKGPYGYENDGGIQPAHAWVQSSFISSSQVCASCHEVSSPRAEGAETLTQVLADGTDTGRPFPAERTYTEWLQSDYYDIVFRGSFDAAVAANTVAKGQTCQQCHMRVSPSPDARAVNYDTPGRRAGQLPVHEFAGGNAWMPRVLSSEYGAALGREEDYERTAELATSMLQEASRVELSAEPWSDREELLTLNAKVINLTGHKLPTGYAEGRLMWLNLQVVDANGELVFESGRYDESEARLVSGAQLRKYEVVHGEWNGTECIATENGKRSFHFVLSNCILEDSRIPPLGFRGANDVEIAPVGRVYANDPNDSQRLVNFDSVSYQVKIPVSATLPVTAVATLKYQTATRDYVEFLRDEAVNNAFLAENQLCGPADAQSGKTRTAGPRDQTRGQFMFDLWQREGRSAPVSMAMDDLSVSP